MISVPHASGENIIPSTWNSPADEASAWDEELPSGQNRVGIAYFHHRRSQWWLALKVSQNAGKREPGH